MPLHCNCANFLVQCVEHLDGLKIDTVDRNELKRATDSICPFQLNDIPACLRQSCILVGRGESCRACNPSGIGQRWSVALRSSFSLERRSLFRFASCRALQPVTTHEAEL